MLFQNDYHTSAYRCLANRVMDSRQQICHRVGTATVWVIWVNSSPLITSLA